MRLGLDFVRELVDFTRWLLVSRGREAYKHTPPTRYRRDPKLTYASLMADHKLTPEPHGGFGPGWLTLVDTLIQDLKRLGWDGRVDHIYSRKGALHFYIPARSTTPPIKARILQAERQSKQVCEDCGAAGHFVTLTPSLVATLCPDCASYWYKQSAEKST